MSQQDERYGRRLAMTLCYASSQDETHTVEALRRQTRASCGWQSEKHCSYPQELVFHFEGLVSVEVIRILSHESKISSCIDVYVVEPSEEEVQSGVCGSYTTAPFTRLGHVRLDPNTTTNFMARELKTVGIKQNCSYLKLVLRKPHHNMYNLFQQVGIVGITAHGKLCRSFSSWRDVPFSMPLAEEVHVSLDEMAPLSMDQASRETSASSSERGMLELADKLRNLQALKAKAVQEEDYDVAEALKRTIDTLERAKGTIAALEKEKQEAVDRENYSKAKELKQRINELLNSGCQTDTVRNYVPPVSTRSTETPNATAAPTAAVGADTVARAPAPKVRYDEGVSSILTKHDEIKIGGKGFYDIDDALKDNDRPVGGPSSVLESATLKESGNGSAWERTLNQIIRKNSGDEGGPVPLGGDAASLGSVYEKDFGPYCVACLLGRKSTLREAATRALVSSAGFKALASHTSTAAETLLQHLSSKGHGVGDPVAGVVFASCDAVTALVSGSLPSAPSLSSLSIGVAKLIPELLARIGDANSRIREGVETVLVLIARSSFGAEKIAAALLVDPDKQAKKPAGYRTHVSRINLLYTLVDDFGVDRAANANALDPNALLSKVVIPSLQHSNGEVREGAIKLFAKLAVLQPLVAKPYMDGIKPAQQSLVEAQIEALRNESEESSSDDDSLDMQTDTISVHSTRVTSPPKKRSVPKSKKQVDEAPSRRTSDVSNGNNKSNSNPNDVSRELKTCQFCGEYNAKFTEANLDMHYVRSCPMLCPCPLCDQVTEIGTLQQHLVSECEGRDLVKECPRCREAVRAEELKKHIAAQTCIEAVATHSVCPLCHARFSNTTEGWRAHLAVAPGCPNNPRKYDGSGPVMQ